MLKYPYNTNRGSKPYGTRFFHEPQTQEYFSEDLPEEFPRSREMIYRKVYNDLGMDAHLLDFDSLGLSPSLFGFTPAEFHEKGAPDFAKPTMRESCDLLNHSGEILYRVPAKIVEYDGSIIDDEHPGNVLEDGELIRDALRKNTGVFAILYRQYADDKLFAALLYIHSDGRQILL